MSESELKRLRAARGQCKASFTRLEKYLAECSDFTFEDISVRKRNLIDTYSSYKKISLSLLGFGDDDEEEDAEAEDRYLQSLALLERYAREVSPCQESTPKASCDAAKLPNLEIPFFDGKNVANYKTFIEMFSAIVGSDARLSKIQKLCFLKKYLKEEPLSLIDNLPIIGKSYETALDLLKKRYDNPALLINAHVTSLLDLEAVAKGTAQQIRQFVASSKQHIAALNNLEQPVEQWGALLSCILLRKLDHLTIRLFHSEREATTVVTVDELLTYLEKRAKALEASPPSSGGNERLRSKSKQSIALATTSNEKTPVQCSMCSDNHKLFKCPKFIDLSVSKRIEFIDKNKLCHICLAFHSQKCRYKFKCSVCNSSVHNTLIHITNTRDGTDAGQATSQVNLHSHSYPKPLVNVLLPTAKVSVVGERGNRIIVRALLDTGSQNSFCSTALAQQLGTPQFNLQKSISTLGNVCSNISNKGINICMGSLVNDFKLNITCSIIDVITSKLPQKQIDLSRFVIPPRVALADSEFHIPGEVSLLLGCDVFFKIILDGKIEGAPGNPILLNTQLGYIVSSTAYSNVSLSIDTTIAMHTVSPDLDHCVQKFWEAEKVPDFCHESLPEHEHSEKVFRDSVSLENNQFEVKYPLKLQLQDIDPSNSYAIALQRFYNLEKRFLKDLDYHKLYKNFIDEYMQLKHAKIIDLKNCSLKDEPVFFLPHHGVLRPDKMTNKLRVVFDGSAKTKSGICLNDLMCNGTVVQRTLFEILLLFRTYKYTIQCDIRHMYRMIQVHSDHRCLQNILWREDGVMKVLQLQTLTYGLTSSAFLATRALIELAKRYKDKYPLASQAILNNSYVDDIQTGSNTFSEAFRLKNELNSIMEHANFKLHKWVSNEPSLLKDVPCEKLGFECRDLDQDPSITKILGISYDAREDVFRLSGRVMTPNDVPTKRNVLSSISRLYDPMGFAGAVTMKAKMFLQELWQHNLEWDTPLPMSLQKSWQTLYTNIVSMPEIIIPRYTQNTDACDIELIGFCDASAGGYGCCIYIKVKKGHKYFTNLLCSKSRLNGINSKLTIPKLELNGAVILAKLISHVASVLNIQRAHLFCDSKIVLSWLNVSPVKLPAYIGNRVKEIQRLTQEYTWHFTPGTFNPADILSRGADPKEIIDNSLWNHGPDYLQVDDNYNFYVSVVETPLSSLDSIELNICTITKIENVYPLFEKYSTLSKTIRVMVYILRFIYKLKKRYVQSGLILVAECREALTCIIKTIQRHYFAKELKFLAEKKDVRSPLNSLHPFVDADGVLRVGGRLHHADVNYSKRFPIILPKHCHITKLIIQQEHLALMHGGLKLVLSSLSQKYYIINFVREVKSVIHKCVVCCRHKAEASSQLMASLPRSRVTTARVAFERVGVDYCGPFDIKQSSKRNSIVTKGYAALFVCFASKAVHIEVVSDLSTDTFIAAFKRFISRRGIPKEVYCDNATTFKGANNQLKDLYELHSSAEFQEKVHNFSLQKEIKFNFIPAYSPNHGGLWESAVKSLKFHLKRISSSRILTYEQLNTVIIEIEGILNSRPLVSITLQDPSDPSYLTPAHFIIGSPLTAIPQPDFTELPSNQFRFWRYCEQVRQHFWKAWSRDYLSSLNQRTKWRKELPNIKEGMIVLLLDKNVPPLHWPLGRVTKAICGEDNKVRVVEVMTSNRKLHKRAVSKIVVLPTE